MQLLLFTFFFFFFNDTATTEIYTLSLHDALPIFQQIVGADGRRRDVGTGDYVVRGAFLAQIRRQDLKNQLDQAEDRKSTRLNSSHQIISYAVFCLKKKKKKQRKMD